MSHYDEPYEDDDGYDEYQDYDQHKKDYAKHWFKFDPSIWKWLYDAIDDITESSPNVWMTNIHSFKPVSIPVNSWTPITGKVNSYPQYLGSNYQKQPIWKTKYFVSDPISIQYLNHISSHPVHFVLQPHYYKGMFDILN